MTCRVYAEHTVLGYGLTWVDKRPPQMTSAYATSKRFKPSSYHDVHGYVIEKRRI